MQRLYRCQIPPRVRQMAIRLKQAHPAARGDRERLIQIPPRLVQFAHAPPQFRAAEYRATSYQIRSIIRAMSASAPMDDLLFEALTPLGFRVCGSVALTGN